LSAANRDDEGVRAVPRVAVDLQLPATALLDDHRRKLIEPLPPGPVVPPPRQLPKRLRNGDHRSAVAGMPTSQSRSSPPHNWDVAGPSAGITTVGWGSALALARTPTFGSSSKENCMSTLKLVSLECIRRHDVTGVDEPAIYLGNSRVWSGVISKGETESLSGGRTEPYPFEGSVLVSLDEVSNGISRQIAYAQYVSDHQTNNGELVFKNSGTHYELRYKVVA
jgi:hypothetical protein